MDLDIDRLRRADVDDALALSTQVGWNQRRADWLRLLDVSPDACFAGRVDGDLVATSVLTAYDDVGWIGMVIVDEDHRRRGFGSAVFERALEAGRNGDLAAIGLDATDEGRTVYRQYGFKDVGGIDRWRGVPVGDVPEDLDMSVEPVTGAAAADAIVDFDATRTGVDRSGLLSHLLDSDETTVLVCERGGERRGYAIGRPGRTASQIGPLVCDRPAVGRALLAAIGRRLGESIVDAPRADANVEVLERAGFDVQRRLHRMIVAEDGDQTAPGGGPLLAGDAVLAAAGFEWG